MIILENHGRPDSDHSKPRKKNKNQKNEILFNVKPRFLSQ